MFTLRGFAFHAITLNALIVEFLLTHYVYRVIFDSRLIVGLNMEKMKINYRKGGNGIRTSITLSTALVDTWLTAKGMEDEDLDAALSALRQAIEETPEPKKGETFQSMVEYFLLSDIRDCFKGMR